MAREASQVHVVVRIRPSLQHEATAGQCIAVSAGKQILLTTAAPETREPSKPLQHQRSCQQLPYYVKAIECEFDQVLEPSSTQENVWECASKVIEKALDGYNATLFTYGMTGSGKTYTMLGPSLMAPAEKGQKGALTEELRASPDRGLVPRALERIFSLLQESGRSFTVSLSYLQIFQEQVFDLLQPLRSSRPLRVREDATAKSIGNMGLVYVEGLKEVPVGSFEAAFQQLLYGSTHIAFRSTKDNERSSRSHTVLTLTLRQQSPEPGHCRESKVRLVDLAGNERWDVFAPQMSKEQVRELTLINRSLHVLGTCVQALSEKAEQEKRGPRAAPVHVPYRDSALTLLLRDSLSGNSFMTLVCTVSESSLYQVQTLCTLRFADRAKRAKMRARVGDVVDSKADNPEAVRVPVRHEPLAATKSIRRRSTEDLRKVPEAESTSRVGKAEKPQGTSDLEEEIRLLREQMAELVALSREAAASPSKPAGLSGKWIFTRASSEPDLDMEPHLATFQQQVSEGVSPTLIDPFKGRCSLSRTSTDRSEFLSPRWRKGLFQDADEVSSTGASSSRALLSSESCMLHTELDKEEQFEENMNKGAETHELPRRSSAAEPEAEAALTDESEPEMAVEVPATEAWRTLAARSSEIRKHSSDGAQEIKERLPEEALLTLGTARALDESHVEEQREAEPHEPTEVLQLQEEWGTIESKGTETSDKVPETASPVLGRPGLRRVLPVEEVFVDTEMRSQSTETQAPEARMAEVLAAEIHQGDSATSPVRCDLSDAHITDDVFELPQELNTSPERGDNESHDKVPQCELWASKQMCDAGSTTEQSELETPGPREIQVIEDSSKDSPSRSSPAKELGFGRQRSVDCGTGTDDLPGVQLLEMEFQVQYQTRPGQELYLVGSHEALGNWDLLRSIHMTWSEGNNWIAKVKFPEGVRAEYKYVVLSGNQTTWESGKNHLMEVREPLAKLQDQWGGC